jgi:MFS family permease
MSPSPPPPTLRRYQTITLALLFFAGVVNFFDRSSLAVANTTVRADLHLSGTEIGWLLSAFSLAYGLSQLPLIALLARTGTRSVLGSGLALWSTAQLLTGFVPSLKPFLALRVLLGIGESPFYPAGVQTVREWFPPASRARATALMSSSQTIGLAIAPPVLTILILRIGWRAMFVLLGAAGLALSAAWFALYRARDQTIHREPHSTTTPAASTPWTHLLRRRTVWGMMLGFGGINYTNWLYTAWVPGYLQIARHLSLARTGWIAAIPFLFGAAGMLGSGFFTDRLVRRNLPLNTIHRAFLVSGMALSAASTVVVARSSSTLTAVAGISMALFFIHFAGTSGWGYAQSIGAPHHVASLSALQNFAGFTIASAAPILTGWLLDRTHSFTLSLLLCGAVTLLGALSYATLAAPNTPREAT